jgi:acetyl-CoA carboxylase biotin carboxyl carrier protein
MEEHGLEEFEYEAGGLRLRLKKPSPNSAGGSARVFAPPEIVVAAAPALGAATNASAGNSAPAAAQSVVAEDLHIVKSPIVGTFYEAPSPGAPPFVKPGDHVEIGQPLCIVEAMKLMNEIESDAAGEVVRIYAQNGQPVEYGESLFAIRPARRK